MIFWKRRGRRKNLDIESMLEEFDRDLNEMRERCRNIRGEEYEVPVLLSADALEDCPTDDASVFVASVARTIREDPEKALDCIEKLVWDSVGLKEPLLIPVYPVPMDPVLVTIRTILSHAKRLGMSELDAQLCAYLGATLFYAGALAGRTEKSTAKITVKKEENEQCHEMHMGGRDNEKHG